VFEKWNTLVGADGYTPLADSELLKGASFTGLDDWFEKVSYVGAFGSGKNWMDGWTNFNPENTDY
jgi:hypothetical protein